MPKIGVRAARKDALVDATIASIGDHGSLDVTMGQIARAAGVSSALAHHYFGSKEALFLATMRRIMADYSQAVRARLSAAQTPQERLEAIIRASFDPPNFSPSVISAWLNFYVLAQTAPEAERLLRLYHRRLVSNLAHALGPLCDDPRNLAEMVAALIDGQYLRHALRGTVPDPEAASGAVLAHIARLLR